MEFIKKNLVRKAYRDVMEVKINCFHGDSDMYTDFTISGFNMKDEQDIELLTDLIETLDRMPGGHNDRRFDFIDGFSRWFRNDLLSNEKLNTLSTRMKELSVDWAWDLRYEDVYAALYYYEIYYHDENGDIYKMTTDVVHENKY